MALNESISNELKDLSLEEQIEELDKTKKEIKSILKNDREFKFNRWIYHITPEETPIILSDLYLELEETHYDNINKLKQELLGHYNESDFVKDDEDFNNDETIRQLRCAKYMQNILSILEVEEKQSELSKKLNEVASLKNKLKSTKQQTDKIKKKINNTLNETESLTSDNSEKSQINEIPNDTPKNIWITLPNGEKMEVNADSLQKLSLNKHKIKKTTIYDSTKRKSLNIKDTFTIKYPEESPIERDSSSEEETAKQFSKQKGTRYLQSRNKTLGNIQRTQQRESRLHGNRTNSATGATYNTFYQDRPRDLGAIISRWKTKFTGSRNENIDEFLETIERRAAIVQMTDEELLKALPEALSDAALNWYQGFSEEWETWEDFKKAASRYYGAGVDKQKKIRREIFRRTQGPKESVRDYIAAMSALYIKLERRPDLEEKIDTIYNNLRSKIRSKMWKRHFNSLNSLVDHACAAEQKMLESEEEDDPLPARKMTYPSMAYKEREDEAANNNKANKKGKKAVETAEIMTETVIGARCIRTGKDARKQITGRYNASSSNEDNNHNIKRTYHSKNYNKYTNQNNETRYSKNNEKFDTNKEPETKQNEKKKQEKSKNEKGTKSQSAPPGPCPRCSKTGHWASDCPNKKELKCYRCGKPGYIVKNCPDCSKNDQKEA